MSVFMPFPKLYISKLSSYIFGIFLFPLSFSLSATAQVISDETINLYAQAVIKIEAERQEALTAIQEVIAGDTPEISCNQPSTYESLPAGAQEIAIAYCQDSENIVQNTGMSVTEFNQITQQLQEDPELRRRIQKVMVQMSKD